MSAPVNPIDVVEAAYDLDGTAEDWLRRVASAIRPLLDDGRGYLAYFFDATAPITDVFANALVFDMDRSLLDVIRRMSEVNMDVANYLHFNNAGLMAMCDVARQGGFGDVRKRPEVAEYLRLVNGEDIAALQTIEPGSKGVVFTSNLRHLRTFDTRTRRLWARVNAHIAAGRRLREALAAHGAADEAILTPSGKLEHAEGEGTAKSAREALREAVLRTERSRGKLRRSHPEEATETWTALVAGRWSLVDRFERGGRRYIVAHRNEHALPDPRALTQRERAVAHLAALGKPNKLIGYELGVAESTVSTQLASAMRKLGATSRVDLIRMLTALGG